MRSDVVYFLCTRGTKKISDVYRPARRRRLTRCLWIKDHSFEWSAWQGLERFIKDDVTRDNSEARQLAQQNVATLFRIVTTLFRHCNAVLRKKSSCESFRVTSHLGRRLGARGGRPDPACPAFLARLILCTCETSVRLSGSYAGNLSFVI